MIRNVYQRQDGRYEGRITLAYQNGKRQYKAFFGQSEDEVAVKMADFRAVTMPTACVDITFGTAFSEWFQSISIRVKESTLANYLLKADKHILPVYAGANITGIEQRSIYQFIKEKQDSGLSNRYITDKSLPDKAIDALDEAGSMVRLSLSKKKGASGVVEVEDIATVVSKMTGIPVNKVAESEGNRLVKMRDRLKERIIGQDEAVETVVKAIQRGRAGLKDPHRPIGTFLFFGPTGVGKTQLARTLAEYLFDSEENMVRIDMSEYMEKFSVSRLIGAPPGYVGYEEGGQLSERVRRKPYCVVLLDEIEKAHPDIFNLLLQVMDEGRLTDSNGRMVDFKNTIVIMTSNVGSREMEEYGSGIGFATAGKNVKADRKSVVEKAVKKAFPPEFINRVDAQVYFNSLDKEAIEKIIDIELKGLKARVQEAGYKLTITPTAKRFIADAGYDPAYGARPLRRAVMRYVEDPVSEFIIADRALSSRKAGADELKALKLILSDDKESTTVVPA